MGKKRKADQSVTSTKKLKKRWRRECKSDTCKTQPNFGVQGSRRPEFCKKHAKPGMVNVNKPRCTEPLCDTAPSFNLPGCETAIKCKAHKKAGMVDVAHKNKCHHPAGCETLPSFNLRGETKPVACRKHASPDMVDVVSRRCEGADCEKKPVFNTVGMAVGKYCKSHKLEGMVDVENKKCAGPGCTTQPNYNKPGEKQPVFCKEHKTDDMVNVTSKKCASIGCTTQPIYNVPGATTGLYCWEHAEDDMVDILHAVCADPAGCLILASYNYKYGDEPLYCGSHRLPKMVLVAHKVCVAQDCTTLPWYGVPSQARTHCAGHKQAGQVTHPRRVCEEEDCKASATFGVHVPERCDKHKQDTDRDLVLKRCIACTNPAQWDTKSDMCDDCDKRDTNIRLRRQRQVKAYLDAQVDLAKYNFYDKAFLKAGKCGDERPDFAWDMGTYWLLLEIDEWQHRTTTCECEQVRMANVTQASGMPCVWIQFNPDDYKGQTVAIRDRHRLEYLVKVIRMCLALPAITSPADTLRVTHLFFDDFDMTKPLEFSRMPLL